MSSLLKSEKVAGCARDAASFVKTVWRIALWGGIVLGIAGGRFVHNFDADSADSGWKTAGKAVVATFKEAWGDWKEIGSKVKACCQKSASNKEEAVEDSSEEEAEAIEAPSEEETDAIEIPSEEEIEVIEEPSEEEIEAIEATSEEEGAVVAPPDEVPPEVDVERVIIRDGADFVEASEALEAAD